MRRVVSSRERGPAAGILGRMPRQSVAGSRPLQRLFDVSRGRSKKVTPVGRHGSPGRCRCARHDVFAGSWPARWSAQSPAGQTRGDNPFDSAGAGATGDPGGATDPGPGPDGADSAGADDDSGGAGDDDIKFDAGSDPDDGGLPGDCECGNLQWSYVFVANSSEGTISKINTRTLEEEARYATGGLSPSRTSVSVDGKAVVVANRGGGVAKYWVRTDLCDPDQNGQPGLQTSTGKDDVLPFGQDDCLAWTQDFANMDVTVQRPVAWTPGEGACHTDQKVWTTTGTGGNGATMCGPHGVWAHLLDGTTGAIEATIHLSEDEFPCDHTGSGLGVGLGPYGGAVDADGNFWFHGWGNGRLARIDFETHEVSIVQGGGYGITVDTKGRVWLSSSISRYDPETGDRQHASVSTSGGIAQDLQDRIWAAGDAGLVWVDMETLAIGDSVPLPVSNQIKGVSVDLDGYVWAVAQGDSRAFKVDPDTYTYEIYDGLDGPYTYSDMTGGAVFNVTCNPPAG
jgi:DNA-binding beta-propeller fold protein YncE